jgi:protein SCO1/2
MMALRRAVSALLLCIPILVGTARAADSEAVNVTSMALPALERVTVIPAPNKAIGDFQLTDQNGRSRSLVSLRGEPTLIFFGFTHCPDVCPTALAKLKLLHGSSEGALRAARVVLISVDGERDTPAVVKKYLATFSPDFIGLTGDPRAVANIAARFSAVAFKEQPDKYGNYGYFHSNQIFVLDRKGRLRASFFDASLANMAIITQHLLDE